VFCPQGLGQCGGASEFFGEDGTVENMIKSSASCRKILIAGTNH